MNARLLMRRWLSRQSLVVCLWRSVCHLSTLPWTTACSPKTMTLPGAETIKGGIIGDDCFLSKGRPVFDVPLTLGPSAYSCANAILVRGGVLSAGEGVGDRSVGISICIDAEVLELDRECLANSAFEDCVVVEIPVIA